MSLRRKSQRHGEYTQVSVADIQLPDPGSRPGQRLVERKLMLERLTQAVGQLGDRCRELLRLKLQGKNFGEIQKRMGAQSINTVYTWDYRCRQQLLDLMGGDWEAGKR
jgi:RNA polymerase sigma-70 factor (ECF subfamily)